MPRVKRRAKTRYAKGYNQAHVDHLVTGMDLSLGRHGFVFGRCHRDGVNYELMQQAWNDLRDDLLPEWIAEKPGTRPWAWWRFDAPEGRQRVDGKSNQCSGNSDRLSKHYRLRWGQAAFPTSYNARYETETAYLDRLDLLTKEEREALDL